MPTVKSATKDSTKSIGSQDTKSRTTEGDTKTNDVKKQSKEGTSPERRTSTMGAQRMGNLRDKFEKGEAGEKKVKKKGVPKIKYAGAESVKNKFIENATKTAVETANGPRGPKQITPPPEGVAVGVLESKPQPRAPDVVTADDTLEPVDFSVIGETTKNLKAKFKHLEETGGQEEEEGKLKPKPLSEEVQSVAEEASKTRARWKDIESGKTEVSGAPEFRKIDMVGEGYGGVYENEPETLENIIRHGEDKRELPAGISAKERREQFLRVASASTTVKKEPAKIDISAAESGIYENEPARRDDVVRYDDDQTDLYPPNSVKWASEAKNRFIQEATKAQERNQRQTVAVVDDPAAEHRFATEAKQAFLERQREVEEAKKNKARPDIIDIWGEQCPHSGVFENTPAARSADVVAGYSSSEEEETEEGEEE